MKKHLLLVILVLALVLSACGAKIKSYVYEIEEEGIKLILTLEAQDDKVLKQSNKGIVDFFVLDLESREEAEALYGSISEQLSGIEGLDFTLEFTDESIIENLVIDFSKISPEDLKGIVNNMDDWDGGDVSLEALGKSLEEAGYTLVK